MFWCNAGHRSGVETAHLDGSSRQLLAVDKVYNPMSLALDLPVKRLYIVDRRMNSIQFCTYDGLLQCHRVLTDTDAQVCLLVHCSALSSSLPASGMSKSHKMSQYSFLYFLTVSK